MKKNQKYQSVFNRQTSKMLLCVCFGLFYSFSVKGQWTDSSTNITTNDKVGIGTNDPNTKLHIIGITRSGISKAEYTEIGHKGTHGFINTVGDGNLDFRHDGVTKMSLDPSGTVRAFKFIGDGSGLTNIASASSLWTANGSNVYRSTGNMGIGTTSTPTPLSIRGNGGTYNVGVTQNQVGGAATMELTTADASNSQATRLLLRGKSDKADVEFYRGARESEQLSMIVKGATGNVGIGKTNPAHKLDVNGTINATGILINGSPISGGSGLWTASGSDISYSGGNVSIVNDNSKALTLKTTNNALAQNIVFQNSGGKYTWSLGREEAEVGQADFVISGGNTSENIDNLNEALRINKGGNVGIGTSNIKSKLHVFRGASDQDISNMSGLLVESPGISNDWYAFQVVSKGGGKSFSVTNAGNVGIGTANPGTFKLAVNGHVRAKEVTVETGWSDFVFEEDYALPTLEEVEAHIAAKGHLQDIPSAKEVEENGIALGEINSRLLQKVEELTLYLIEQNKELKAQREEIEILKNK